MNLDILFNGIKRLPNVGEEIYSKDFKISLGGGKMVIPLVLDKLGIETKLGTYLGNDVQSKIAKILLKEQGFTSYTNFYEGDEDPTVVSSVLSLDEDRIIISNDVKTSIRDIDEDTVYNFLKDSNVVFAPYNMINVLRRLKENEVKIVYDIGWDDNLDLNSYIETLKYIDVFAPNDKEAMKMTNTSTVEDAVKVLSKYVKHPVITIGNEGCITYKDNKVIRVGLNNSYNVVDTSGAGDNFITGIVYGLLKDCEIEDCMKYGNIFGAKSTEVLGCYNNTLDIEYIDRLYNL
jgi:sugar/nucleoside kinase (ribokinase family)